LLDPTRYAILLLRALGLVGGLNHASRLQEAQIISHRKVRDSAATSSPSLWQQWELRLSALSDEWLAAAKACDQFRLEHRRLKQQIKRLGSTQEEMLRDLKERLGAVRTELRQARQQFKTRKDDFFSALQELRLANLATV